MNATPRTWLSDPTEPRFIPSDGDGIWVECEATTPKSRAGQTVYVFFAPEQIPSLLKECRRVAIKARSKPMSERTDA